MVHRKRTRTEIKKKLKIKLRDGKEREIQHMISTSFWSADGKPISAQDFYKTCSAFCQNFLKMKMSFVKSGQIQYTQRIA